MPPPIPLLKMEPHGDTLVVMTSGDLGEFQFYEIEQEAEPILRRMGTGDIRHVVIDMAATDYCGSATLAFFLKLWVRVRERQGRLALCGVSPVVRDVLAATKMDSIWPVYPTREEALAAVHQSDPA
jgi:anti-sigma B factor antagonist